MNDFMARWVLTAGILCLLLDGRSSYLACRKWVGSDIIFFALISCLPAWRHNSKEDMKEVTKVLFVKNVHL